MKKNDHKRPCPFCGNNENCGKKKEKPGQCWCDIEGVPIELRELILPENRMKACICKNCVKEFKANPESFKENISSSG